MQRLFIINPKAGAKAGPGKLQKAIKKHFASADIALTQHPGHAKTLAAQAAAGGYAQVIACGGDGTINEVAQGLALSGAAMGVIALGSGNGLAREIGAPLGDVDAACKALLTATAKKCDLGRANGEYFINLCGLGLEADIAAAFDASGKNGKRGKWPYFKIGAQKVFNYRAPEIALCLDGGPPMQTEPLTLVFSNGRQYGSGFKIAPKASFCDGFLDMTLIPRQNKLRLLAGLPNFWAAGLSPVEPRQFYRIKTAQVALEGPFNYHIDGEPRPGRDSLTVEICPAALTLLVNTKNL